MLNKIIGALLIAAAVWAWFNFCPGNKESRGSLKTMLISIAVTIVCVCVAGVGICIFNGSLNFF